MAASKPSARDISKGQFSKILSQYDSLIEQLSAAKPSKQGSRALRDLDQFRYEEAVEAFSSSKPKRHMTHDDVKTLVEWKLRHGKFRPTLMGLVSSNESAKVADTIQNAMAKYWKGRDVDAALKAITALKGVGPATAALLLSVHDPNGVIFFSDEAFWWLCCGGQKQTIKYNPKEYQALRDAAQVLKQRLGVGATDIEKVAYVIFKDEPAQEDSPKVKVQTSKSVDAPGAKKEKKEASDSGTEKAANKTGAKRKLTEEAEDFPASMRRSKRKKT